MTSYLSTATLWFEIRNTYPRKVLLNLRVQKMNLRQYTHTVKERSFVLMDLLTDSETKSKYEKCKYIVKLWEQRFKKKNGRIPSKLDIREAPEEVRCAYRKYFTLKTAALEHSFRDVDGFNLESDEVAAERQSNDTLYDEKEKTQNEAVNYEKTWGAHLNKKSVDAKDDSKENLTISKESDKTVSKITKKLFSGSKFSKRNPRKSLPLTQSKSEGIISNSVPVEELAFLSQPAEVSSAEQNISLSQPSKFEDETPIITNFALGRPKILPINENVFTKSTNFVQSIIENQYKPRKSVDADWLERIQQNTIRNEKEFTAPFNTKLNYDSDDVIEGSDDENSVPFHVAKKSKVSIGEEPLPETTVAEISTPLVNITALDKYDISKEYSATEENIKLVNNPPKLPTADTKAKKSKTKKYVKEGRGQTNESAVAPKRNLNENFVKINIKKKVYVRGKKTMTYSKYKKQMWKKKKGFYNQMQVDDIGDGIVKRRGRTKADSLLPLEAALEEPDPYLTLEEAAKIRGKPHVLEEEDNEDVDKVEFNEDDYLFDDNMTDNLIFETLKLEEKLDLPGIKPYYELKKDGTVIDTPDEVYEALSDFGHSSFRPGQEKAVMRVLSGLSTVVTLSTGSGKSLCYQLPAYLLSQRNKCVTLVISPLVSLMEDQVKGIPKFLKAACLHTNQTPSQRNKIVDAVSSGNISILLVSPEAVVSSEQSLGFGSLLKRLPPIAFACIDEAHCLSQWSHNFRPSYLVICRILQDSLGIKTILGLTATATKPTISSLVEQLRVPDDDNGIISDVPVPDNLILSVSQDTKKDAALIGLLTSEEFADYQSVIVYCTRRDECERIATFLRTTLRSDSKTSRKRKRLSVQAEPYHAGLSAARRKSIQKAFMSGEIKVVVATIAFGMGINKSDIRSVIHYNMPSNFESYVQEIGRAGRDGLLARCHIFLDKQDADKNELQRHIFGNTVDRHIIRKLLQKVFVPCSCEDTCSKHEILLSMDEIVAELDVPKENISTLLCYLELHKNKYVKILKPSYTKCKVISYGGVAAIQKASESCPPLATALKLFKNRSEANIVEFPVLDVASRLGWETGSCKQALKNVEWIKENGAPKRSTLTVKFFDLGFRLTAPGNLTELELDEALDTLYSRVLEQEKTSLFQLHHIHNTLKEMSSSSYQQFNNDTEQRNNFLKLKIREYFNSSCPVRSIEESQLTSSQEEQIVNAVRVLIGRYRETTFTGRAIARIFHGIASPNFPAYIWGKCKFWRSFIDVPFNGICKLATSEIVRM